MRTLKTVLISTNQSRLDFFCIFSSIFKNFNHLIKSIFQWIYTIHIQIFSQKLFFFYNFEALIPLLLNLFVLVIFLLIKNFWIRLLTIFNLHSVLFWFINNRARSIIFVMNILRGWFSFHQFWNWNDNILRGTLWYSKFTNH